MSKFLINKVLPLAFLVIALAISLLIIELKQKPSDPEPTQITVDGMLICLPHKTSPSTLECTLGIRSFEKEQYGVQFSDEPIQLNWETPYRISGSLVKDSESPYDIIGTIVVDTIEQLTTEG